MSAVSTVVSAASQSAAAEGQAQAADYNAKIAQRNAAVAREQASRDEEQQRRDARKQLGLMRASYGASGITPEGSPLDVLEASAAEAELDAQNIRYKGELRAMGYNDEATLDKYSASTSRSAAGSSLGAGLFSSATSLLTTAGKVSAYQASRSDSTATATAIDRNASW